jgi:hypothetical protein
MRQTRTFLSLIFATMTLLSKAQNGLRCQFFHYLVGKCSLFSRNLAFFVKESQNILQNLSEKLWYKQWA